MKAITIKQPFASLIIEGYKEYEFRTWRTKYRGDILIHAGKGVDKKAMEKYKHLVSNCPSGCILGIVKITDCIKIDDEAREMLKDNIVYDNIVNNKDWDGFGFKIESIRKVENTPANGKLSLWDFEGEIIEK
jgi:hypothetical protein